MLITRLKLSASVEEITEETPLFGPTGLGIDSIDVLELIIGIKKEFGVEIADRETAEKIFTSVGEIARFIDKGK